ncbi:hypothetical protein D9619_011172 [Psilocybe cf. subviscida]|uniref:Uncharacterized protein n=1 Tax=Psilocybe cf. subviscida TaxID=2480587 RepID=A0A8H5BJ28_9AGAR|nr:hypothetical protein D9619_011172 [Psilocybe cf. subviscida]
MWFTSCWFITYGLAVLCRASTVAKVLNDISILSDDAEGLENTARSFHIFEGTLNEAMAVHTAFDKVNGDLINATTDINALSPPSDTDAFDILDAMTTAKPFVEHGASKAEWATLFFYNFTTVAEQVQHDISNFTMLWSTFQYIVFEESRARPNARVEHIHIDVALAKAVVGI